MMGNGDRSKTFHGRIGRVLMAAACVAVGGIYASSAQAIPAFARSEGQDCNHCHTAFPKLNETGLQYKMNGYRFPDVEVTNVWDDTGGIPFSILVELEGFIDHTNPEVGPSTTVGPDGTVDELELMAAGNLGPKVSFFSEVEFDKNANSNFGPVWAQINDLVGSMGAVNVRVGQFTVDLPFLSEDRRVVRNKYLAFEKLGLLDTEFGLELNGQSGAADSTHRYAAGVIRSNDSNDKNHFLRGFGWYSHTWNEMHHVGALVIGGQDFDGVQTFDTIGLGIGAETQVGAWTLTAGYFFEHQDFGVAALDQSFHNVMGEVLFMPDDRWVIGGRLDYLVETERVRNQDWGLRASVLARYNILANVWAGAEYRIDEGGLGSPLTANDNVQKGRLFLFFAL